MHARTMGSVKSYRGSLIGFIEVGFDMRGNPLFIEQAAFGTLGAPTPGLASQALDARSF